SIFNQRPRSKVPEPYRTKDVANVVHRGAGGDYRLDRSRNLIACRVEVREMTSRPGQVGVEGDPPTRAVVVRPLDAITMTRPARLGCSSITNKQQLGLQIQGPRRERRLEPRDGDRPEPPFNALRSDEWSHWNRRVVRA